jgi:hypothetical protein
MAHISTWEKLRKSVTGSYSESLTLQIAQEEKAAREATRVARERIAAQQAAAKAAEAKFKAEQEAKAAAKIAEVKAAAKPQAAKTPRDGDGDGKIHDGTKNGKPAPKKPASTTSKKTTPKKK